jgi:hypothetical protein
MDIGDLKIDNHVLAERIKGSVAENARKLGVSRGHLNNILKGPPTAVGQPFAQNTDRIPHRSKASDQGRKRSFVIICILLLTNRILLAYNSIR